LRRTWECSRAMRAYSLHACCVRNTATAGPAPPPAMASACAPIHCCGGGGGVDGLDGSQGTGGCVAGEQEPQDPRRAGEHSGGGVGAAEVPKVTRRFHVTKNFLKYTHRHSAHTPALSPQQGIQSLRTRVVMMVRRGGADESAPAVSSAFQQHKQTKWLPEAARPSARGWPSANVGGAHRISTSPHKDCRAEFCSPRFSIISIVAARAPWLALTHTPLHRRRQPEAPPQPRAGAPSAGRSSRPAATTPANAFELQIATCNHCNDFNSCNLDSGTLTHRLPLHHARPVLAAREQAWLAPSRRRTGPARAHTTILPD
jgi:hypothetical protein